MDKFISFIKKNKKRIIIVAILLIVFSIFVFATYTLYKYLTPDTKDSVYGDRCELTDGIDITSEREKMIKEVVESYEGMKLTDVDVKCNLIDIIVIVEDEVEIKTVKEMSNKLLTVFTEEELKYYDIALWVDSEATENEKYPIIGTRHKTNNGNSDSKFVWQLGDCMKKKIIILITSLVLIIGISVGVYLYLTDSKDTSFTSSEAQWLAKNKVYAIDFYMPSDIAGLTYMGEGVFFDFVEDMEERTGLDFNEVAYQVSTPLDNKEYSIELVSKINDNQVLMFSDHYVIITHNQKIYTSTSEIDGLKLGVQSDMQEDVSKYLTGSNVEYVTYDTVDELSEAMIAKDGTIDGVVVLKSLFLDEVLNYDLHVAYHIPEIKMNYVLTLNGEKILNNIIKKSYNKWSVNQELSYDKNLLDTYFDFKGITEKEKTTLREKAYTYAFIENGAYDTLEDENLIGINYLVIKDFAEFANVDMEYSHEYENTKSMVTAFNDNKIDFFFGNIASEYEVEAYYTSAPIDSEIVILSNIKYSNIVNNIYSLSNKKVNVVAGTKIESYLKNKGLKVVSHDSLDDLIDSLKNNSIVAMDMENYEYYKSKELLNFKIDYILSLDEKYNYVINADNKMFAELFDFYLEYNSVQDVINNGYASIFEVQDSQIYLIIIIIILAIIVLIHVFYNMKRIILFFKKRKKSTLTKTEKIRYIDSLTSLKNRAYLNDNIEKWDDSEVYPQIIIIVDLNNIAYINDNFGHEEGDKVITEAANILIQTQMPRTEIIRTDGNEFLIYMVEYDEKQAVSYIRKLNKEFKDLSHGFGAATGYSIINDGIKTIDDAVNEATLDMRTNKEAQYEDQNKF